MSPAHRNDIEKLRKALQALEAGPEESLGNLAAANRHLADVIDACARRIVALEKKVKQLEDRLNYQ